MVESLTSPALWVVVLVAFLAGQVLVDRARRALGARLHDSHEPSGSAAPPTIRAAAEQALVSAGATGTILIDVRPSVPSASTRTAGWICHVGGGAVRSLSASPLEWSAGRAPTTASCVALAVTERPPVAAGGMFDPLVVVATLSDRFAEFPRGCLDGLVVSAVAVAVDRGWVRAASVEFGPGGIADVSATTVLCDGADGEMVRSPQVQGEPAWHR